MTYFLVPVQVAQDIMNYLGQRPLVETQTLAAKLAQSEKATPEALKKLLEKLEKQAVTEKILQSEKVSSGDLRKLLEDG